MARICNAAVGAKARFYVLVFMQLDTSTLRFRGFHLDSTLAGHCLSVVAWCRCLRWWHGALGSLHQAPHSNFALKRTGNLLRISGRAQLMASQLHPAPASASAILCGSCVRLSGSSVSPGSPNKLLNPARFARWTPNRFALGHRLA